jgi:hypothetical protein
MTDELRILTSASGGLEADMIREWLAEAGIHSLAQMSRRGVPLAANARRDVYVYASDLQRAAAVLNAEAPSARELDALRGQAATQRTRPQVGEPIEIPVPGVHEVHALLGRAARPAGAQDG